MLNMKNIHPSWNKTIKNALASMNKEYLTALAENENWLPGPQNIFNAFSIPLESTHTLLLGESPYPREASANGYAFWDAAVHDIWSETGLSKPVNRATSLRNIVKMLLRADDLLDEDTSQPAIAAVNKTELVQTLDQLFGNMLTRGFLLLNASLVLSENPVKTDAKEWRPFMQSILEQLAEQKQQRTLLLFGKIAQVIEPIAPKSLTIFTAEHPYNISFIKNPEVIELFKPLQLLRKNKTCPNNKTSMPAKLTNSLN